MQSEYQVTLAESYTLMLLGIIAVRAGYRDILYRAGKDVSDGRRSVVKSGKGQQGQSVDFTAWKGSALNTDPSKPLERMRDFRNHLFHGNCHIDRNNGTLTIRDSRENHCTSACKFNEDAQVAEFTPDELSAIAGWFVALDPERSVRLEVSFTEQCSKCGATRTGNQLQGPLCACGQQS